MLDSLPQNEGDNSSRRSDSITSITSDDSNHHNYNFDASNQLLSRIQLNDPDLTNLDLSFTNITVPDIHHILLNEMKSNTSINTVNVSGHPISNIGAQLLATPNHNFTSVLASGCNITDATELAKNNRLFSLTLSSNDLSAQSIALLSINKTLKFLSLAGNNIGDDDVITLSNNVSLFTLILSHNKIGIKGAQILAEHSSVLALDLSYNPIETEGVIALSENTHFTSLAVAGNRIALDGIRALARNNTLTKLDISANNITNSGAVAVSLNTSIIELNLSYNEITMEGAYALSKNKTIVSLIISRNLLRDTGAIMLSTSEILRRLDVSGNRIGFEGAYALAMNKTLTSLALSSNILSDVGGVVLAQNTTLNELLLSYNSIKDAGAMALAKNSTLKILNLNYNMIGDKGKQALLENKTADSIIVSSEQPPEFTDENLDTIFLLSASFFCICDLKGTLQFFNPSFSRALGYSQDELLAQPLFKFLHPLDIISLQQQLHEEKNTNVYNYENRYQCKDGSYRIIRWTSHIKHDRLYASGTDVSEQRRIEKDLISVQQATLLNRIVESEKYNLQQNEFISHLSHEIRNPLSGIYGLMELLKQQIKQVEIELFLLLQEAKSSEFLKDKLSKTFQEIEESFGEMIVCAEYQKTILNDNLDILKINEKKLVLQNHSFELVKTLKQLIVIFKAKAIQKGIDIKPKFPNEKNQEEVWIKGDDLRFKQIVVNLLGNAVKFTPSGSVTISFKLRNKTDQYVQVFLKIIDTGIGVSPEEIDHLFQRFSQANSCTGSQYGGSGLGLYLAKQLANAMGGDITIQSKQGKGSTFTVMIPFAISSAIEAKQNSLENLNTTKASIIDTTTATSFKPFTKRRILVVDDNEINQKILHRILVHIGHECEIANNGKEALTAFDNSKFDLILMDIIMPIMDGITATKEIRKRETERNLLKTPVCAITANALEQDHKKGIEAGIDYYITKPFNSQEIYEKINALPQNIPTKSTDSVITQLDPILNIDDKSG